MGTARGVELENRKTYYKPTGMFFSARTRDTLNFVTTLPARFSYVPGRKPQPASRSVALYPINRRVHCT